MRRPVIGFLCASASWGGLEMNVLRLAHWLRQRGWRIVLYTIEGSILWNEATAKGIALRHLRSSFKYGDFVNAYRLVRLLADDEVEILVMHERRHIMLGALAKLGFRTSLRLVYIQHMHVGVDKKDLYHTWLYGNVDAWVTPLQILKQRLLQKTYFDSEKVVVIPFGLELQRFSGNLVNKLAARRAVELPPDVVLVGMVGRLEPEKCQETLVRAVSRLRHRGYPVEGVIVGDETLHERGGYLAALKHLAAEIGVADVIHFRPALEDVANVYAALDIFSLTSKSETYGMVTIEAMAAGLPVIGTCHGGTREIIEDGVNGLHVERESPGELADAISRLLDNPDLALRLASRARQDAATKYSHTRQCELTEELFYRLSSRASVSLTW